MHVVGAMPGAPEMGCRMKSKSIKKVWESKSGCVLFSLAFPRVQCSVDRESRTARETGYFAAQCLLGLGIGPRLACWAEGTT